MAWVKLDDQLYGNPKVRRVWQEYEPALGLYLLALSHAGSNLTDGFVDEPFVRMMVPNGAKRGRSVGSLIDAGLWTEDPIDDGYWIHDYLDYNDSREEILKRREWDQKRKSLFSNKELVAAIRRRDGDRCRYCGCEVNWRDRKGAHGGTYDHVSPRGENSLENLVVACRQCNSKKGGRTPNQASMELISLNGD